MNSHLQSHDVGLDTDDLCQGETSSNGLPLSPGLPNKGAAPFPLFSSRTWTRTMSPTIPRITEQPTKIDDIPV